MDQLHAPDTEIHPPAYSPVSGGGSHNRTILNHDVDSIVLHRMLEQELWLAAGFVADEALVSGQDQPEALAKALNGSTKAAATELLTDSQQRAELYGRAALSLARARKTEPADVDRTHAHRIVLLLRAGKINALEDTNTNDNDDRPDMVAVVRAAGAFLRRFALNSDDEPVAASIEEPKKTLPETTDELPATATTGSEPCKPAPPTEPFNLATLNELLETGKDAAIVDWLLPYAVYGNKRATEALLEYLRPLVVRYCRRKLGSQENNNTHSADDVAQEVCLAAVDALPNFVMKVPFLAFVYGIAAHKVIDTYRANSRNRSEPVADMPESVLITLDSPEEQVLASEAGRKMSDLLGTLPPKQREILRLRIIVGLSAEETARIVGGTEGAVRITQYRALHRIRRRLLDTQDRTETTEKNNGSESGHIDKALATTVTTVVAPPKARARASTAAPAARKAAELGTQTIAEERPIEEVALSQIITMLQPQLTPEQRAIIADYTRGHLSLNRAEADTGVSARVLTALATVTDQMQQPTIEAYRGLSRLVRPELSYRPVSDTEKRWAFAAFYSGVISRHKAALLVGLTPSNFTRQANRMRANFDVRWPQSPASAASA